MRKPNLLSRGEFRDGVFARDGYRCVFCHAPAVDAHHIIERKLWVEKDELGGYFMENGASVCEDHHRACERTDISVEDVRQACGIQVAILPRQLEPGRRYDKWGNEVLPDGRLVPGPLFWDGGLERSMGHKFDLFVLQ